MSVQRPVRLANCPVGLFVHEGELCLKTEYTNRTHRVEAYIVSSGEFFSGPAPQTAASQLDTLVIPLPLEVLDHGVQLIDARLHALRYLLPRGGRERALTERIQIALRDLAASMGLSLRDRDEETRVILQEVLRQEPEV